MDAKQVIEAFRKSHKKHIFITGSQSSGKSTLAKALVKELQAFAIYSEALYEDQMLPVKIVLKSSQGEHVFATYSHGHHQFDVDQELFLKTMIPFLNQEKTWKCIDEIGFVEGHIEAYNEAIQEACERDHLILVLRKGKHTPLLDALRQREDAYMIDLDDQQFDISCIVMASGYGRRFGSNKLLEPFGDKTLFEHTMEQLPYHKMKQVIVVTRYPEIVELAKKYPVDIILNSLPHQSDTIRLGMENIQKSKGYMFVTCDQPLRTQQALQSLLLCFSNNLTSIVRLAYQNKLGNPVIFPDSVAEELKHLKDDEKGSTVIRRHQDHLIFVEASHRYELEDIDTRDDLNRLLEISIRKEERCI